MWLRHLSPVHRPRKPCSGCVEPSCAQWSNIKLLFPKRFVTKRCQTSRRRYLLGLWVLKNQVFDLGYQQHPRNGSPKKILSDRFFLFPTFQLLRQNQVYDAPCRLRSDFAAFGVCPAHGHQQTVNFLFPCCKVQWRGQGVEHYFTRENVAK